MGLTFWPLLDNKILDLARQHFSQGRAFHNVILREPAQFTGWEYPAFNMMSRTVKRTMGHHGDGQYHAENEYPYSLFWMQKGTPEIVEAKSKVEERRLFEFAVSLFDGLSNFTDGTETLQNIVIGDSVIAPVPTVSSRQEVIVVVGIELIMETIV